MDYITTFYAEKLTLKMKETEEDFIVEHITPFLELNYKYVIPKEVIKRALTLYMETYPEEFKMLIEEAEKKEG